MLYALILQSAATGHSLMWTFRHLGALGLLLLTVLDSSPLPTFGGADILVALLSSSRHLPWYVYTAIATAGSTAGAYLTFRLARKAGEAYLDHKFGQAKVSAFLNMFKKWGTGGLVASTAIPFPFPTSVFFAAAGASDYHLGTFLGVVAASRAVRYCVIAFVAQRYGRSFITVLRHPTQYWGWLLAFALMTVALIAAGVQINKRLGQFTGVATS
jgi:membrane protein YqaA with SNARE-associated domain